MMSTGSLVTINNEHGIKARLILLTYHMKLIIVVNHCCSNKTGTGDNCCEGQRNMVEVVNIDSFKSGQKES